MSNTTRQQLRAKMAESRRKATEVNNEVRAGSDNELKLEVQK